MLVARFCLVPSLVVVCLLLLGLFGLGWVFLLWCLPLDFVDFALGLVSVVG